MEKPPLPEETVSSRRFAAAFLMQLISRVVTTIAILALYLFVARGLGASVLGRFSYILSYIGVAAAVADLGTVSVLSRDLILESPSRRGIYFGTFLKLRLVLALASIVAAWAGCLFVPWNLSFPIAMLALIAPFLGARFFDVIFQIEARPQWSAWAGLAYALSMLLAAGIGIFVFKGDLYAVLAAYAGANIFYVALASIVACSLCRPDFSGGFKQTKQMLRLAVPIGLSGLFVLINNRIDVFLLGQWRSTAELGLYAAAYRFLDLGTTLAGTLMTPLLPVLSGLAATGAESACKTYGRILTVFLAAAIPVLIVLPHYSALLLGLLYGEPFRTAGPVLDVLGWALAVTFYDMLTFTLMLAMGKIPYAYWNSAVAMIVNISLNLVWIPKFGILGAAWATLASAGSLAIVQTFFLLWYWGNPFDRSLVKLAILNLALFAGIWLWPAPMHPIAIAIGVGIYAGLVAWRVIPLDAWRSVLNMLGSKVRAGSLPPLSTSL